MPLSVRAFNLDAIPWTGCIYVGVYYWAHYLNDQVYGFRQFPTIQIMG